LFINTKCKILSKIWWRA